VYTNTLSVCQKLIYRLYFYTFSEIKLQLLEKKQVLCSNDPATKYLFMSQLVTQIVTMLGAVKLLLTFLLCDLMRDLLCNEYNKLRINKSIEAWGIGTWLIFFFIH
jgi:hypothetical protein